VRILGFEIGLPKREKAAVGSVGTMSPRGGWWSIIHEPFTGAWQRDIIGLDREAILSYATVYACITLIASDIGKLRLKLVEQDSSGIWVEVSNNSPFLPVLRKPNRYQTRQKFVEQWIVSKLIHGNTYVLKQRDQRGVVTALYVLDPTRVTPLVTEDGGVYYQLSSDYLAQVPEGLPAVPASEIIHDTMVCLHHPLVGVSPLYACGLAAAQGLAIQKGSARFFGNNSQPGGLISAPARIDDATARRIKEYWEHNYTGNNVGKVAVLGDGLKYEAMAVNAVDSQLIDQLKLSAEQVCSAFHVPPYKVGVGQLPSYQNAEILNQIYYSDCLQSLIESIEALLDDGLGLTSVSGRTLGTEFELEDLLKTDTLTRVKAAADAIGSGAVSPNEARRRWLNLKPVTGGGAPYMQQQNYSLAALAARDMTNPLAAPGSTPAPTVNETEDTAPDELEDAIQGEGDTSKAVPESSDALEERGAFYAALFRKDLEDALNR
jgi:HK97 family phage portal protein